MDNIPLWGLFLMNIALSAIAIETGFRLSTLFSRRGEAQKSAALGTMVQSTLALLAFLLAFTFGIAAERFNDRRLLIVEESNAIGTSFLRAGFLPEPARTDTRNLLRKYVTLRTKRAKNIQELQQAISESQKIQEHLWEKALEFGKRDLNSDIGALFVDSLNKTIDLQSTRIAASLYARIPDIVWSVLYVVVFLGMASIGYQEGGNKIRSWSPIVSMVLSFALVLVLIADLDRPSEGFLKTNLQPMKDLADKMGVTENAVDKP